MRADRRLSLFVFLAGLAWSACFHHTRDWNSASRLLLTHAIVQFHSVEITPFVAVGDVLVPDPPTRDMASPDHRRYFSDKAPGQALLGAAVFAPLRAAGVAKDHPMASDWKSSRPERLALRFADYLLTLGTSGVCAAAAASILFSTLRIWGCTRPTAVGTALALALGSPWQVYGTLYYGHVAAGYFLILTLHLIERRPADLSSRIVVGLMSGLCAGFAVVVEYTMAAFVLALCTAAVLTSVGRRAHQPRAGVNFVATASFLGAGLLIAWGLGWYHWSVTGDPFVPPYRYEVQPDFAAVHAKGSGIPLGPLQHGALFELLAGSSVGLLWFAPAVLWGVPGIFFLLRDRPLAGWTILLTSLALVVVIGCFPNWNGGLATGPRFLTPLLPFLFLAMGVAWDKASRNVTGRWLVGLSMPVVAAGFVLNTAMNAAGARKPFGLSVGDFLYLVQASALRERHLGDWLLSGLGVPPNAALSFIILLALGACGGALLLRASRRQDV